MRDSRIPGKPLDLRSRSDRAAALQATGVELCLDDHDAPPQRTEYLVRELGLPQYEEHPLHRMTLQWEHLARSHRAPSPPSLTVPAPHEWRGAVHDGLVVVAIILNLRFEATGTTPFAR